MSAEEEHVAGAAPGRARKAGGGDPLRALSVALALAALGPSVLLLERADPISLLAWLAVLAPAVGFLAGRAGLALVPFGLVVPGVWGVALALADGRARVTLGTPFHGVLVLVGLFAAGLALGALAAGTPGWAGAGVLLLGGALLAALASRGGLPGAPLPPGLTRLLLDLSPASLALESAGVDWMRDAAVYDPAATDRFVRAPYRGSLAGPLALLVGCASAALAHLLVRRAQPGRGPQP